MIKNGLISINFECFFYREKEEKMKLNRLYLSMVVMALFNDYACLQSHIEHKTFEY